MKQYILMLGCLLLQLFCRAQYDSLYKTTYYEQKVSQFRLIPDTEEGEVIFLGDSITDIAEWSDFFKNNKVKNRGISGDNTFGVLNRLDEITQRKPRKVFIMIGINDIAINMPDSIITANYQTIVQRIKATSPTTKIYLQSILPTNNGFTAFQRHQNKQEHIIAVNSYLQALAAQMHCTYINLYDLLVDKAGRLSNRYTNDGLHLTGAGYMVWKNELTTQQYCCE